MSYCPDCGRYRDQDESRQPCVSCNKKFKIELITEPTISELVGIIRTQGCIYAIKRLKDYFGKYGLRDCKTIVDALYHIDKGEITHVKVGPDQ